MATKRKLGLLKQGVQLGLEIIWFIEYAGEHYTAATAVGVLLIAVILSHSSQEMV